MTHAAIALLCLIGLVLLLMALAGIAACIHSAHISEMIDDGEDFP